MENLCVHVSGTGTNLRELKKAHDDGRMEDSKIALVVSDNADAGGLILARNAEIPYHHLDYRKIESKLMSCVLQAPADFNLDISLKRMGLEPTKENIHFVTVRATVEEELLKVYGDYGITVGVGAGFLKRLSSYFLMKFQPDPLKPRFLNIHPALSPAWPGVHAYEKAWKKGVKVHGITIHYIDDGVDTGPIIRQCPYFTDPSWTLEEFQQAGLNLEYEHYWRCIALHVRNCIIVEPGPDNKQLVTRIIAH